MQKKKIAYRIAIIAKPDFIQNKNVLGKKEEIWIVDDFVIDGNNLNNPVMLLDTFDFGPREDNWFFYPGGNIGLYCPYSSKGAP